MKICEICKKTISEDEVFGIDGHESVCFECAEAEALKAKEEKREIQITHGEFAEAWSLCQWCDSLFPESELQEERDSRMGNSRKPGASANGATAFSRKANFRRSTTSDTSADTAFPPLVPGARKYG